MASITLIGPCNSAFCKQIYFQKENIRDKYDMHEIKRKVLSVFKNPYSALNASRFIIQNTLLMAYVNTSKCIKNYDLGKVTIITPSSKNTVLLYEAINSVQRQNYNNWEHIIVSDGYDKNKEEMISKLNDKKILYKYTHTLHVMGNYQRNYALKYATGEYILYLDDDNVIFDECLASMVSGFNSPDVGYVTAPIIYGDKILEPKYPFEFGKIDLLNYMVKRELVEKIWGQNRHTCADLYLIQKISKISKGNHVSKLIGHHR